MGQGTARPMEMFGCLIFGQRVETAAPDLWLSGNLFQVRNVAPIASNILDPPYDRGPSSTSIFVDHRMARYYFHISNGRTELDTEGTDFDNLQAARASAVSLAGAVIAEECGATLWDGQPWTLWVTDAPHARGATLFSLNVSARLG